MLVTVTWLGSFAVNSFWVLPGLKTRLDNNQYLEWLVTSLRRLITISWISISFLTASGLFQMADNSNYGGFLNFGNLWSLAILIKHVVFFAMVLLTAFLSWKLFPNLQRAQLLSSKGKAVPEIAGSIQTAERIIRLNFWLGAITLALTALARIS